MLSQIKSVKSQYPPILSFLFIKTILQKHRAIWNEISKNYEEHKIMSMAEINIFGIEVG